MASTGLDFSKITPDNGAVRELSKLLFLNILDADTSAIGQVATVLTGVHKGDKVVGIGEFGAIGKKGGGCKPEYDNALVNTVEKEWKIEQWAVNLGLCYADVKDTLVKYAMRWDKDVADLTSSDYLIDVVEPRLQSAIEKAVVRMMFLGDTAAAHISGSGGGNITAGKDLSLFTTCDGFFKRVEAIAAEKPASRVTIEANAKTTYAEQMNGIRTSGVAMKIFDDMIFAASGALIGASDKVIIATRSLADALAKDIRDNNKGSELQWQSIMNGVDVATYDGITVVRMPILDDLIREFNNTGTALVNPHRAILTTKNNLLLGTPSDDIFSDLDVWFDRTDKMNYISGIGWLDTQILDDNLVISAF